MKDISDYTKPVTIYIRGSVKVEFSIIDSRLTPITLRDTLRLKGFGCTDSISISSLEEPNLLDISFSSCVDEKLFIPDLVEYIESFLGEGTVLDRTKPIIKKESKHMNK